MHVATAAVDGGSPAAIPPAAERLAAATAAVQHRSQRAQYAAAVGCRICRPRRRVLVLLYDLSYWLGREERLCKERERGPEREEKALHREGLLLHDTSIVYVRHL